VIPSSVARNRVLSDEDLETTVPEEIGHEGIELVLLRVESRRRQLGNGMLLNDDACTARAGELNDGTEVVAVTGGGGEGGAGLELELRLAKLAGESSVGGLVGGSLALREREDLVLAELVGVLLRVLLGVGREDGEDGLLVLLEDLESLLSEGWEDDE
jgi:hypothetical protein